MDDARSARFMALALDLSRRALPACRPNPPVCCVFVHEDRVVATGFTQSPGLFHAEACALHAYPHALFDVDVFVTLEPCAFHGRTPSCAKALIGRGVRTVHVGMTDPDPRNNGKGLALLRAAGVAVQENVLRAPVAEFLAPHLFCVEQKGSNDATGRYR